MSRIRTEVSRKSGQALIEVLVAAAIIGVVGLTALSLMGTEFKETKGVSERLGSLDLEKTLIASLADGSVCKFIFAGQTFSAADPAEILVDSIPAAPVAGAPTLARLGGRASEFAPSLVVNKIALANLRNAGVPNSWLAEIQIVFDSSKLTRPIHPVTIQMSLQTDPALAGDTKKILNCSGTGAVLCTPGPKIYIGTEDCDKGHLTSDPSFFPCASEYLGTLCKTQ